MDSKGYSVKDIYDLFKLEKQKISRQTILRAESDGLIPTSTRVKRGKVNHRIWSWDQIPDIGKHLGFLKTPNEQKIISIYTAKGGVLKTTYAYTLGRTLGLHGIKTLIIGLDIQCSITEILLPPVEKETLQEMEGDGLFRLGLYHYISGEIKDLDKIIKKTDLHTLDVIPETYDLNKLENDISGMSRREEIFKNKLIPNLKEYDVVVFDNGPNWNHLTQNSLTASSIVISPIGCDYNSFTALGTNLAFMEGFGKEMELKWEFYISPTLLKNNKLSAQINAAYLNQYADKAIHVPIRDTVKGDEAVALGKSIFEYLPKSGLADDYYDQFIHIWGEKQKKNERQKVLKSNEKLMENQI